MIVAAALHTSTRAATSRSSVGRPAIRRLRAKRPGHPRIWRSSAGRRSSARHVTARSVSASRTAASASRTWAWHWHRPVLAPAMCRKSCTSASPSPSPSPDELAAGGRQRRKIGCYPRWQRVLLHVDCAVAEPEPSRPRPAAPPTMAAPGPAPPPDAPQPHTATGRRTTLGLVDRRSASLRSRLGAVLPTPSGGRFDCPTRPLRAPSSNRSRQLDPAADRASMRNFQPASS